jgi:hypothetical protein
MVLVSTGLVKALPQATASHPTLIVSGDRSDQEIQKISPLTAIPGGRRAEGYRNGHTGNY